MACVMGRISGPKSWLGGTGCRGPGSRMPNRVGRVVCKPGALGVALVLAACSPVCAQMRGTLPEQLATLPERLADVPSRVWLPAVSGLPDARLAADERSTFVAELENRNTRRLLHEARELEAQGLHLKAIAIYQSAIRTSGTERVPVTSWAHWPLKDYAQHRIGRMGPKALGLYADVYGPVAARLFGEAREAADFARMREVADNYLHTAEGRAALGWLGSRYFARGDFARGVHEWQRFARFLPELPLPGELTPLKLAVCFKRLGLEDCFARVAGILDTRYGATEVRLAGRSLTVGKFIADLRDEQDPVEDRNWESYGGASSNSRPVRRPTQVEGWLWSSDYLEGVRGADPIHQEPEDEHGLHLPYINPVVSGGALYYQSGTHVIARHLTTGQLRWAFSPPIRRVRRGTTSGMIANLGTGGRQSHFVAFAEGHVLANLGTDLGRYGVSAKRLFCLRAADGAVVWDRGGPDDPGELLSRCSFYGAPAVEDGRLFCVVATTEGDLESYLVCLDASTGDLRWKTFICLDRLAGMWGAGRPGPGSVGPPAVVGGLVYCSTGMGAVAAVGTEQGQVEWIARYARRVTQPRSALLRGSEDARLGWETSAPIAGDGTIFLSPEDSPELLCLDAATGIARWRRGRDGNAYLLGVRKGRVYLSGSRIEIVSARDGRTLARSVAFEDAPAGQGLVGPGFVYCPGKRRLHRVFADTGKAGPGRPWREGTSPGHMVQAGEILVVSGLSRIDVYAGEDYYRQQVVLAAKQPDDAAVRLEVGYLSLSRNELPAAVEHLSAALRLSLPDVASKGRDLQSESRQLLCRAYTGLAERALKAGALEQADEAYQQAFRVAPEGEGRFAAISNLARHAEHRGQWKYAVQLNQQLLEDYPTQRVELGGLSMAADLYARERIRAILAERGRQHYAEFEQQAAELLRRAGEQDWAVRCAELCRRFPNSQSAEDALVVLGTQALKEGRPVKSFRYWKQLSLSDMKRSGTIAGAYLAACYAQMGEVEAARGLVGELKARHGSGLFRFLDEDTNFKDFGEYLFSKLARQTTAGQADLLMAPVAQVWSVKAEEARIMSLGEAFDDRWTTAARRGRVLLAGRGGIECIHAKRGGHAWRHYREDGDAWLGIRIGMDETGVARIVDKVIDAPAREAGLQAGDRILQIGESAIHRENGISDVIRASPKEVDLPIWIERGTNRRKLTAQLRSWPENVGLAGVAGEVVILGSQGKIFGVDLVQGKQLWSQECPYLASPLAYPAQPPRLRFAEDEPPVAVPLQAGVDSSRLGLLGLNIMGSRLGVVRASDGSFLWETAAEGRLIGAPVLTEDAVVSVVQSASGSTRAVVRGLWTGRTRFELALPTPVADEAIVVACGRDEFCAVADGRVSKLDARTGRALWSYDPAGGGVSRILVSPERVVLLSAEGLVVMLGAENGRVVWTAALPEGQDWAARSVLDGERLFAVSTEGQVCALEEETGRTRWKSDYPNATIEGPFALLLTRDLLAVAESGVLDQRTRDLSTRVTLRETETGKVLQEFTVPGEIHFSRALEGTYVVVTSRGVFGFRGPPARTELN